MILNIFLELSGYVRKMEAGGAEICALEAVIDGELNNSRISGGACYMIEPDRDRKGCEGWSR